MRMLIDGTPLSKGGGVQGAIGLIVNLYNRSNINWMAVLPCDLYEKIPSEIKSDNRILYLVKKNNLDRLRMSFAMQKIERKFQPEVVYTINGPAYFIARSRHVVGFALPRLIYEADGPLCPPGLFGRIAERIKIQSFHRADHVIVQTETVRDRLISRLNIDGKKISVIGNCVNPLLLKCKPQKWEIKNIISVLVPSVYYKHKNLEIIPKVARVIKSKYNTLNFEFRLTLNESDKNVRDIVRLANELGVKSNIVFLGPLPLMRLAEEYNDATIVYLPTLREASTAVYPESFYFQRPIVTSNLDFARELCGNAAVYVPPLDAEVAAEEILKISKDDVYGRKLIVNGIERLNSVYPSAEQKFAMQIEVLSAVTNNRKYFTSS